MPKSLQILLARKESISLCLGTVDDRPVAGLKNKLCFAPSFTKTQPYFRKCARSSSRFMYLYRNTERFPNHRSPEGFCEHAICFYDKRRGFFQVFFYFAKGDPLCIGAWHFLNPANISMRAPLIDRSKLSLCFFHTSSIPQHLFLLNRKPRPRFESGRAVSNLNT